MRSSRPTHINFYESVEDFLNDNIKTISIAEAEKKLAKHRNISSFTWIENFNDQESNLTFSEKIIDPNNIALCYFGADVGYGTVAVMPIKKGEILIFTGDTYSALRDEDHCNPYMSGGKESFVNAKYKGGFASMVLDLPTHHDACSLSKKAHEKIEIAQENFSVSTVELSDKEVIILTAERDIASKELIGVAYAEATRLMYNNFIGFYTNGTRLSNNINSLLNNIVYKTFKYRDTLDSHKFLNKTIKSLNENKLENVLTYLKKYPENISELKSEELDRILNFLSQISNSENISIKENIIIEINYRKNNKRNFIERKFAELVLVSNSKQLEFKGKSELHMYGSELNKYYVIYPDIDYDFCEIGKQHELRGSELTVASEYYKFSLFYAKKLKREDTALLNEVELRYNSINT